MKLIESDIRAALACVIAVQDAAQDDSDAAIAIARVREAAEGRPRLGIIAQKFRRELTGIEKRRRSRPQPVADAEAIAKIAAALDRQEWTADTASQVAEFVREAGYEVRDPEPEASQP